MKRPSRLAFGRSLYRSFLDAEVKMSHRRRCHTEPERRPFKAAAATNYRHEETSNAYYRRVRKRYYHYRS